MINAVLVTLQIAAQVLRVPAFRIIHLCETGCVTPFKESSGRGSVRRFNRDNLFLLAVCLELQNAGIPAPRILRCVQIFSWVQMTRILKGVIAEQGLCGAIEALGSNDSPVMLHVKVPERGTPADEALLIFIQTKMRLPTPPESGMGFFVDSSRVDLWPVRVSLNLTHILSTIRFR